MRKSEEIIEINRKIRACDDAMRWLESLAEQDPEYIWNDCAYAGWLLSYCGHMGVSPVKIVDAAIGCARSGVQILTNTRDFQQADALTSALDEAQAIIDSCDGYIIEAPNLQQVLDMVPHPTLIAFIRDVTFNMTNAICAVVYGLLDPQWAWMGVISIEELGKLELAPMVRSIIDYKDVAEARKVKTKAGGIKAILPASVVSKGRGAPRALKRIDTMVKFCGGALKGSKDNPVV